MRVTQNIIYSTSVRYMNEALSDLMEANTQLASEKRINKASDDPAGASLVMSLGSELASISDYTKNIETADSWLSLADSELSEASTLITSIIEKAQQASSETYTAGDRATIAIEVRQLFEELMNVANTEISGKSIFAGQKTDSNAYEASIWATVMDDSLDSSCVLDVSGDSSKSIWVEFLDDGTIASDAISYRYTTDGGESWAQDILAIGDNQLDLGTATLDLASGTDVTETTSNANGSIFIVRPAMTYLGDNEDGSTVTSYGTTNIDADADGTFASEVIVRVDAGANLPAEIEYSYSLDNGVSWVTDQTASNGELIVPGGTLELTSNGSATVASGAQFTITPNTAKIDLHISESSTIAINNVGKDVFGGLTVDSSGLTTPASEVNANENLFEAIGDLIGYLEVNSVDGVGDCLDTLTTSQDKLLQTSGDVGARLNRLEAASNTLEARSATLSTYQSNVQDVDVTQLSTDLAKYEYIYEAVLSSSTIIMNLSLLDYI